MYLGAKKESYKIVRIIEKENVLYTFKYDPMRLCNRNSELWIRDHEGKFMAAKEIPLHGVYFLKRSVKMDQDTVKWSNTNWNGCSSDFSRN